MTVTWIDILPAIPDLPCGVRVLIDLEHWIEWDPDLDDLDDGPGIECSGSTFNESRLVIHAEHSMVRLGSGRGGRVMYPASFCRLDLTDAVTYAYALRYAVGVLKIPPYLLPVVAWLRGEENPADRLALARAIWDPSQAGGAA